MYCVSKFIDKPLLHLSREALTIVETINKECYWKALNWLSLCIIPVMNSEATSPEITCLFWSMHSGSLYYVSFIEMCHKTTALFSPYWQTDWRRARKRKKWNKKRRRGGGARSRRRTRRHYVKWIILKHGNCLWPQMADTKWQIPSTSLSSLQHVLLKQLL